MHHHSANIVNICTVMVHFIVIIINN